MRKRVLFLCFSCLLALSGATRFALADDHGSGSGQGSGDHGGDHHGDDHHGDDHHGDDHGDDHHGDDHHGDDHNSGDHNGGDCKQQQSGCPCVAILPLFGTVVNGQAVVSDCIDTTTLTSVVTSAGTFALTDSGAMPPYCSISGAPPFISVTSAQAAICRALLRQAATNQNIACHGPE